MSPAATSEYRRPWLYPKQQAAIFPPTRYAVIEASTKSGKTTGCIVWLVEQALRGSSGKQFWWVAPVYRQTKIAYRRLKRALPRALYTPHESDLSLTLANGATIVCLSGEKPDNLYGEDVYAVVIDEASRLREEAWYAIRSTVAATNGPLRIIGNVKGRKNWMYRLARMAEGGTAPEMSYAKLTAKDAIAGGVLSAANVEDAARVMPATIFRELFYAEPSDDTGNPFGNIGACVADLSRKPPVVWGVDLARKADWTVAIALDETGRVCRVERWREDWEMIIQKLAAWMQGVPAFVDSTGVGDPVVEALQRRPGTDVLGYPFTSQSKQRLMEGLAVAIQRKEIRYPAGPITAELEAFEYEVTRIGVRYAAPPGLHDDCVCALALAWYGLGRQPVSEITIPDMKRPPTNPMDLGVATVGDDVLMLPNLRRRSDE